MSSLPEMLELLQDLPSTAISNAYGGIMDWSVVNPKPGMVLVLTGHIRCGFP